LVVVWVCLDHQDHIGLPVVVVDQDLLDRRVLQEIQDIDMVEVDMGLLEMVATLVPILLLVMLVPEMEHLQLQEQQVVEL
jgi:hypothetical protein